MDTESKPEDSMENVQNLIDYMSNVSSMTIDIDKDVLYKELSKQQNVDKLKSFTKNDTTRLISITQLDETDSSSEGDAGKEEDPKIFIDTSLEYKKQNCQTIIFMKKNDKLDCSNKQKIKKNLQLLNFTSDGNDKSVFNSMQNYIQSAFSSLFASYQTSIETDANPAVRVKMASLAPVQTKLNELSALINQAQKTSNIPTVNLTPEPDLKAKIDEITAKEGREPTVEEITAAMKGKDTTKINDKILKWEGEVTELTHFTKNIAEGNSMDEVNFWRDYEAALRNAKAQIESPNVQMALAIVKSEKSNNRLAQRFEENTKLDSFIKNAEMCNFLLRELPIVGLTTATQIPDMADYLKKIFESLRGKMKVSTYPVKRMFQLIETISKDINAHLIEIYGNRLMTLDYEKFHEIYKQSKSLFVECWSKEYDNTKRETKAICSTRRESSAMIEYPKLFEHDKLFKRIKDIKKFRKEHKNLLEITQSLNKEEGENKTENPLTRQIRMVYAKIEEANVLDLTEQGQIEWNKAKEDYNTEKNKIEEQIASSLTEQLASAQNENQQFKLFEKFGKFLNSPRVQTAISEYQNKLITYIYKCLGDLEEKLLQGYSSSSACQMNKVKGIPEKAGIVLWQIQFKRKAEVYSNKMGIVLGPGWENKPEGKNVKDIIEKINKKSTPNVEDWIKETVKNDLGMSLYSKKVIEIVPKQSGFELRVNFEEKLIDTYKEEKFIKNGNFPVNFPYSLGTRLAEVKKNYPFAIALQDSFRTFNSITEKVKNDQNIQKLIAAQKLAIHELIRQNYSTNWGNYPKLDRFTKEISEKVARLDETVRDLVQYNSQIENILTQISKDELNKELISNRIKQIQKIMDNIKDCSNVKIWVNEMDSKLEKILIKKLEEVIQTWLKEFLAPKPLQDPLLLQEVSVHKIKISDQVIYLEPTIFEAREFWYNQFHQAISIITSNQRLRNRLEESSLKKTETTESTYKDIVLKIDPSLLQNTYKALEDKFMECEEYVKTWFSYQVLWNIQPEGIYGRLGDDMEKWQQLMNEIKAGRKTFDNNETEKIFGSIVIDYSAVQAKINNKYDGWHKEIMAKFASQTDSALKNFYHTISEARNVLENNSFENMSTDIVEFITEVQEVKKNQKQWQDEMTKYKNSKKILDKQRYHFPPNFTNMDQVESEWSKFKQILDKKSKSMQDQIPAIQGRISDDSEKINAKIKDLEGFWSKNKPYKVDNPTEALKVLNSAGTMLKNVKDDYTKNCKAKELLEMEFSDPNKLDGLEEDIQNLKEVWTSLNTIWAKVDALKDTPFAAVQPDKIKVALDEAAKEMSTLPPKMRTYEAYDCVEKKLQHLKKTNNVITDLRSPAVKDRHWKNINKLLQIHKNVEDFVLDDIWQADPLKYGKKLQDILDQATGELVLENFIKNSKESWGNYELEMVRYKDKCKLIRGWDDMFSKLDEHINMFQSMSNSPHYPVFKDDIEPWKEKLEKARLIFNEWVDVQRRWVYLEGIFFGSSDIMNELASDYNKFKSIDNEFTGLMKKVAAKPYVLEVIGIPNIKSILEEKLKTALERVQKALYNFLEKQRSNFARFYFIGDEDLLEIIGNSKDVYKITRHFNKMFAGMNSLKTEDQDTLTGMSCREQEVVDFEKNVKISDDPTIYKWLGNVQNQMQFTLATKLEKAVHEISEMDYINQVDTFIKWIEKFPAQITVLSSQVLWSASIECALTKVKTLPSLPDNFTLKGEEDVINNMLSALSDQVLKDIKVDMRKKLEQLITELVHQRDVVRLLMNKNIQSANEFDWLYYMRFYFYPKNPDVLKRLQIKMSNAPFDYGFEYLGVAEKLIQTPLTDRCYLTLTQGLYFRMGGAPFGPAGTGKTESVKALGGQMGRFVLVFNCDEKFDFKAMGRIFVGLCQVGAWGCFDEFNRLEERILSAVSQQILIIQTGLKESATQIDLMGKIIKLNHQMGIFITMNPGYAGRSQLPDNLKQLFRSFAMIKPDKDMIAQVTLFSQGYKTAERLSTKMVSLFELCGSQLSSQPHYDFGLRALKSVLVNAGNLKRMEEKKNKEEGKTVTEGIEEWEQNILLKSVCNTLIPKLVREDLALYNSLLTGVFPNSKIEEVNMDELKNKIIELCNLRNLEPEEGFINKILQLYSIQNMHHGLMLVGTSGTGKSAAWKILFEALQILNNKKGEKYIIDPKAINKDNLYGTLDPTTLDWTDGVFTGILRKILDNQRGEMEKMHWIIFDGDVDPEWAENLNSVLDDNKLLTLPHGDRLSIPPNVRIMFEVESLKYATLATVSRCGMIWFSNDVVSIDMMFSHYLKRLQQENYDDGMNYQSSLNTGMAGSFENKQSDSNAEVRRQAVEALRPFFVKEGFVPKALEYVGTLKHIMDFTVIRVIESMFALLRRGITNIIEYNDSHSEYPMSQDGVINAMKKWLVISMVWGFGGSLNLKDRSNFSNKLKEFTADIDFPDTSNVDIIDYGLKLSEQQWETYKKRVPNMEIDSSKVSDADLVITTVDTIRHQEILCSWISEHRPFILCGPPGSGKTMTLMATLKVLTDFDMVFINFSSSTTPDLLLKTFDQYCEYVKSSSGMTLRPKQFNKYLVVFCDEINLPDIDKYNTQVVITFLRQFTEQNGFWRPSDKQWIKLERIQFVGACNPPTDVGRHPLNNRFLRHCPLLYVDFPGKDSLKQIYGTFNKALLMKSNSELRGYADALTDAMVEFYTRCQQHYTPDMRPHYIYSPRELTRWKHALNESIENMSTINDLARLWAHEALRLFQDRLVLPEEKEWCDRLVDEIGNQYFTGISADALQRPILFTDLINKAYVSCDREELLKNIDGKLKIFYEEELNVPLVIFDSVLENILRIDRVLKQPVGHLLLVGASGVGKTTLSRFVSWMNNLTVFQIKAGRNYGVADFDADLRAIMKRAGCKGEKICFIFDESNVLGPAFLERMNALLASGEVPGLFEGDEYISLISSAKENLSKESKGLDTEEEIYKSFVKGVQRNLHVVFTMNPLSPDFSNRAASSPALYNRCVINWFGDWPKDALFQVANKLTEHVEFAPENFSKPGLSDNEEMRGYLVESITEYHMVIKELNDKLSKNAKKFNYITPRDFLDFIKHLEKLQREKNGELNEQQVHISKGLDKIKETEETVNKMRQELAKSGELLAKKEIEVQQKLQQIIDETNKAEKRKVEAEDQKVKMAKMTQDVETKKKAVQDELDTVLPKMQAAQAAVGSLTTQQLANLTSLKTEKPKHSAAIRCIGIIYTYVTSKGKKCNAKMDYATALGCIKKSDFKNVIKGIKPEDLGEDVVAVIRKEIANKETWNIQNFSAVFKEVGLIGTWIEATVECGRISNSMEPMKAEIRGFEEELKKLDENLKKTTAEIEEIGKKIEESKKMHSASLSEKNKILADKEEVEKKVERSLKLLGNLSSEKDRWSKQMQDFSANINSLLGDTFLSSAFLAYIGFYDAFYRKYLREKGKEILTKNNILYTTDLNEVEWLTKPNEKLSWQNCSLPNDDICFENATILQRFNRYPLIIDPAGQATEFIKKFYEKNKLVPTSFTDTNFIKTLEAALRFGYPILVQDVEKIDPIMNSLLNKEVHKQGGRNLIRIGDQEIDFSVSFNMFMVTRDSSCHFTPDLCSRVTFLNFTITPSSLQNQILSILLKSERPEVDKAKEEIMVEQRAFKVQIRNLEEELLVALNSEGNIIENEKVMTQLETIKKKSKEISDKIAESESKMADFDATLDEYKPLAAMSSKIYFALDSMDLISYYYRFSLAFFMDVLNSIIKSAELAKIEKTKYEERKDYIINQLFMEIYHRVGYALLNEDKLIFATRLAQIRLDNKFKKEINILLKATSNILSDPSNISENALGGKLTLNQRKQISDLIKNDSFRDMYTDMTTKEDEWIKFINEGNAENVIPLQFMEGEKNKISTEKDKQIFEELIKSIILLVLRPDRMMGTLTQFLKLVFSDQFINIPELDLAKVVENETNCKSPILFCSAPGHDASSKIEELAKKLNKRFLSIAIGSPEGFELVEKNFPVKVSSGEWLVLKNVHLAPAWLNELEKKLYSSKVNPSFRLFLTMENNPKIPANVLRISRKFSFELPSGIRPSLLRSYAGVLNPQRSERPPLERCKLHFLLAWFHAVISERLRYVPIGWSKFYEFNESDQNCALMAIDEWLDIHGKDKQNLSPDKIPWDAIQKIISQSMYGGKIDNEYDMKILESLVKMYFNEKTYDFNYPLYKSSKGDQGGQMLTVPDQRNNAGFIEWIKTLPAVESPEWSGLPSNAEKLVRETASLRFITQINKIQGTEDEELSSDSSNEKGQASWLIAVQEKSTRLLENLPKEVVKLETTEAALNNPIFRFLKREVGVSSKLLNTVRTDLSNTIEMSKGNLKSTNELREIAKNLFNDIVPQSWKVYNTLELNVTEWILDLKNRITQLNKVCGLPDYGKKDLWLGGLIFPEAYLTATRQAVATELKVPLDELVLSVEFPKTVSDVPSTNYVIKGLCIEGAEWNYDSGKLVMTDNLFTQLPPFMMKWSAKKDTDMSSMFPIPVYLNTIRKNLLFSVYIKNESGLTDYDLYQRGIALISWNKTYEYK
ncbi:MAG: AAA family ATPase [archaeon]|nr:AAA family ATPase [archaeon]